MSETGITLKRLGVGLAALAGITVMAILLSLPEAALASVSLSTFDAFPETDRIILRWETESEVDTLGFNIWRGTQCNESVAERVNAGLIPATGQGALGDTYEFADSDLEHGVLYDYRIEDVDNGGQPTCHQEYPVQARLIDDNTLVTATPNSNPGSAPTSTTEPTSIPGPTETPAPTNTPQPAGDTASATAGPDVTAEATVEQLIPTATAESVSAPTATPEPPADVETEASGIESVVGDDGGDVEANERTLEVGEGGDDPQATADAQAAAEAAGAEEVTEVAEAGDATQTNTVGAGAGTDTGASAQGAESGSADDGSSTRNVVTIILVLIGGLFFTLGGIAAVWFFFINRNG